MSKPSNKNNSFWSKIERRAADTRNNDLKTLFFTMNYTMNLFLYNNIVYTILSSVLNGSDADVYVDVILDITS